MDDLPTAQRRVLTAIIAHLELEHRWPTCAELARTIGWSSPSAATGHMRNLERAGYLERSGRHYRLARHRVRVERASYATVDVRVR